MQIVFVILLYLSFAKRKTSTAAAEILLNVSTSLGCSKRRVGAFSHYLKLPCSILLALLLPTLEQN